MSEIIGWTVVAIVYLAYFLDISIDSAARIELAEISKERETERVADACGELPLEAAEDLLLIKSIRLNEAWRRLGYTLAPHFLARMLLPVGNPAR